MLLMFTNISTVSRIISSHVMMCTYKRLLEFDNSRQAWGFVHYVIYSIERYVSESNRAGIIRNCYIFIVTFRVMRYSCWIASRAVLCMKLSPLPISIPLLPWIAYALFSSTLCHITYAPYVIAQCHCKCIYWLGRMQFRMQRRDRVVYLCGHLGQGIPNNLLRLLLRGFRLRIMPGEFTLPTWES